MPYQVHTDPTIIFCNISKANDKEHQLIYASQLYGTFFAVSAKLNLSDKNDDNNTELLSMDLHLINYKGLFNIGLLDETENTWFVDTQGTALIVLHLSALSGTHGHGNNNVVTVDCKNTKVASLSELLVTRELSPMRNSTTMLNQLEFETFDSEFYERDGSVIDNKKRIDNIDLIQPNQVPINPLVTIDGRCRDTKSKFV